MNYGFNPGVEMSKRATWSAPGQVTPNRPTQAPAMPQMGQQPIANAFGGQQQMIPRAQPPSANPMGPPQMGRSMPQPVQMPNTMPQFPGQSTKAAGFGRMLQQNPRMASIMGSPYGQMMMQRLLGRQF